MPNFIRAAEVWVPDAAGQLLEFGSGVYLHAPAFGHLSRSMCFGRGEGLPGRVWDEGRPVVLRDLQGGYFQRAQAARTAGLASAVGFAVHAGDSLKAVVVIFCGPTGEDTGTIQVHAGGTTAAARLDGQGLVLPCAVPGAADVQVEIRAARASRVAARIERWGAGADATSLTRLQGVDEALGDLPRETRSAAAEPTAFAAFATGVPLAGPSAQIALPRLVAGEVTEVVVIHV